MNELIERRANPLLLVACALIALFIALLIDPVAGNVPQNWLITDILRFFNFIGNGIVLAVISVLIFLTGLALKSDKVKYSGLDAFYSSLLAGAFVQILKAAFERPRPSYAGHFAMELLKNPAVFDTTGRFNSLPSGHSTVSFAVAYALGKNYPRLRIPLYAAATLVAIARVYLGSHFPSDVVLGAILGIGAGWLITAKLYSKTNWLVAGLLIATIFVSFFKSGSLLLFDVDEAVFSEASREMIETGDYVTPTYNYEPRYDKPILIYWFMSSAYRLFGVNEFAARFTSAGFGALLVMMTFFFMRRIKGDLPAFFAAIALLLNLEYFVYTHSAVTDMTLGFFITAALFSFYLCVTENDERWASAFWIASALAVLTKGAVGLLFPVSIAFLYLLASRDIAAIKMFILPRRIYLFFIIAAPWFALETYINGMDFINAFIIKHHFKRYTEVISSHGGPFYYYLGVLIAGFFPWITFVPESLYKGFKELRHGKGGLYLFGAIWFLFILIFFSISSTKLPNYIFPLIPAAAVLCGLLISGLCEMEPARRAKSLYLLMLISAIFAAGMFIVPHMELKAEITLSPRLFQAIGVIFVVMLALTFGAASRPIPSLAAVGLAMIVLLCVLRLYALPAVNIYLQKDLYDFASYARKLGKETKVAAYEINQPSIAFYAQRQVPKVEKARTCDIKEYDKAGRLLVITTKARVAELGEFNGLRPIAESGKYVLLANFQDAPPFNPAHP